MFNVSLLVVEVVWGLLEVIINNNCCRKRDLSGYWYLELVEDRNVFIIKGYLMEF